MYYPLYVQPHELLNILPGAETSLYSCNGVFTSTCIFRYAFPAKIAVSGDVRIETNLIKKWRLSYDFLLRYSVLRLSFWKLRAPGNGLVPYYSVIQQCR